MECALTHWAARHAGEAELDELDQTVAAMAAATTWADYHLADEHFHRTVAVAGGQDRLLRSYQAGLTELYRYFLPYPIDYLRGVNDDHADLVRALRARDTERAVDVTLRHVSALHQTMFVGLTSQT